MEGYTHIHTKVKGQLQLLFLFYHVFSRDLSKVIGLGSSHLTSSRGVFSLIVCVKLTTVFFGIPSNDIFWQNLRIGTDSLLTFYVGVLVHVCLCICKCGACMFGIATCAYSPQGQRGIPLYLFTPLLYSIDTRFLSEPRAWDCGSPISTHTTLGLQLCLQPHWALQASQI